MSIFTTLKNSVIKALNPGYANQSFSALMPLQLRGNIQTDPLILAQNYKKWIYKCCTINAFSVAQTEWKLISFKGYKDTKKRISKKHLKHDKSLTNNLRYKLYEDFEEIYTHPALSILQHPNPKDSVYDLFYKIETNLELFGTAYLLIDTLTNNTIQQIDVLHSQFIQPDIDIYNNVIKGYRYNNGGKQLYYSTEQIIQIQFYNPLNDLVGYAPLQAILTQQELDMAFDEYSLAMLNNGGIPSSVIKYTGKSTLKEDERDKLESYWNKYLKGVQNNGKVKIIANDYDVIKLGADPVDMDFQNGRAITKEAIFNAYGVPVSFAQPKDTNRASLDTSLYIYEKFTVTPRIKNICDAINKNIIERYGEPDLYLSYENPVQDDKAKEKLEQNEQTKTLIELVKANILTPEEAKIKLQEYELGDTQ